MTPNRSNPGPQALAELRQQLRARWQAMAPRERRAVGVALLALFLLGLWFVALRPAWQVLRDAPAQRAALDAQLAEMRGLAAEARDLRAQPPVAPDLAEAAIKAATARLGASARLTVNGDRASVSFQQVDPQALADWLGEVRQAGRARVIEAQLNRSGSGYNGNAVLTLPRAL